MANYKEELVVKPSIELIADEYEHFKETTPNIAVHTFASSSREDQDSVSLLVETLNQNGYVIDKKNLHCLDTDNFDEFIKNVYEQSNYLDGLILFFSGYCKDDGTIKIFNGEMITIQEVVTKFTSYACPGLKNKPKIFIFHVKSTSLIRTDSAKFEYSYDVTYDTPAEADMLIVYKKTESLNSDFVTQLCRNIENYGKMEDLISLVTCLEYAENESRPLIVSTLTRKFYLTLSEHRGHHFHIHQNHKELKENLEEINDKLLQVNNPRKTKLSQNTAHGTIKRTLVSRSSTGSSNITRSTVASSRITSTVKTTSLNNRVSLVQSDTGSSTKTVTKSATKTTDIRGSRGRLMSNSSSTSVAERGNRNADTRSSRNRLTSVRSDTGSVGKNNTSNDKPRWKN